MLLTIEKPFLFKVDGDLGDGISIGYKFFDVVS